VSFRRAGDLATRTDTATLESTSYGYDALGNLRRVALPDGRNVEYVIDGESRRVGKRVNGTLQQGWLYADALRIVAETDGSGAVIARFVYGAKPNVPEY
jgi:YD repeat-containing protein